MYEMISPSPLDLRLELLALLSPPYLLPPQSIYQSFSRHHPSLTGVGIVFQILLLSHRVVIQLPDLGIGEEFTS